MNQHFSPKMKTFPLVRAELDDAVSYDSEKNKTLKKKIIANKKIKVWNSYFNLEKMYFFLHQPDSQLHCLNFSISLSVLVLGKHLMVPYATNAGKCPT